MEVEQEYSSELSEAAAALARRDLLTAAHLALRTGVRLAVPPAVRSAAFRLLTLTAVQLESPVSALTYAVAANLLAQRAGDAESRREAEAVLNLVVARYPCLSAAADEEGR